MNWHFRGHDDFYAGGNNFFYFSAQHARNKDFRGPDFYFVKGVPRQPLRKWWCAWEEGGMMPHVIVELTSPTTAEEDYGVKKATYESLRVPEYYCYDPDAQRLQGWRLAGSSGYASIEPDQRGWLWCETLQLWLGPWKGVFQDHDATWLRFYKPDGVVVPIGAEELAAEVARLRAQLQPQPPKNRAAT